MNVHKKMNLLTNSNATKKEIISWAYDNRIHVTDIHLFEPFGTLEKTVNEFYESDNFKMNDSEFQRWEKFLDFNYID